MYLIAALQVGLMLPQAVYFPIRTLYLTLKIRPKYISRRHGIYNGHTSSPV